MRSRPARWLWICSAGALLAGLHGCAPPMLLASAGFQALSSGTAVYVNGELEVAYRVPFGRVWEATQIAMSEMEFRIVDARIRTQTKALLFAEEFAGRSTTISVTARTPVVTKVTIRVGLIGDQSVSRLIMDRLEAKMAEMESLSGAAVPGPIPPPPDTFPAGGVAPSP